MGGPRPDLDKHQLDAIAKLSNGKILRGGVGSGKSRTSLAYYMEKESPKDIYVITTAKKRNDMDWETEAIAFGIGTKRDGTLAGVIKVDSWNNIAKYVDVENAFFILDEQRLVGAGAWSKAFLKIAAKNNWIMLTATPADTWLDYIPVFIANGFYKNRTEFKRRHVVYNTFTKHPKVDRYVEVNTLVRHRNNILVQMPYKRHTTRVEKDYWTTYDEVLMKKAMDERWDVYENEPLRDVAALIRVMRKIVNSSPSRTDAVRKLLESHPKLIVFYNFDYELELLRELGESLSMDFTSQKSVSMETRTCDMVGRGSLASTETSERQCTTQETPACSASNVGHTTSQTIGGKTRSTDLTPDLMSGSEYSTNQPTISRLSSNPSLMRNSNESKMKIERLLEKSSEKSFEKSLSTLDLKKSVDKTSSNTQSSKEISKSGNVPEKYGMGSEWTSSKNTSSKTQTLSPNGQISEVDSAIGKDQTFAVAEYNGHKHQPIPKTDSWLYLVQYTAGAEGWNCIETDAICFYSQNYSYRIWEQCKGRIDRLNTKFAKLFYYNLKSRSQIDLGIGNSLSKKGRFNEGNFGKKLGFEK